MDFDKEKIEQFWTDLSIKRKIVIFGILGLLLLWLMLNPKYNELKSKKRAMIGLRGEVQQKRLKLINARNEIKKAEKYKKKQIEFEKQVSKFRDNLILENQLLNLTDMLTFREKNIDYLLFKSKEMKEGRISKELPIEVGLETTYFLLGKYVEYIEQSDFVVDIKKIVIKKKDGFYNKIKANLTLIVYISK